MLDEEGPWEGGDEDDELGAMDTCFMSKLKSSLPFSYCISLRKMDSTSHPGNSLPMRSMSMSWGKLSS